MIYTDEAILSMAKKHIGPKRDDESMQEYRERYAQEMERRWNDPVDAWEIRTGRSWKELTPFERAAIFLGSVVK